MVIKRIRQRPERATRVTISATAKHNHLTPEARRRLTEHPRLADPSLTLDNRQPRSAGHRAPEPIQLTLTPHKRPHHGTHPSQPTTTSPA